MTSAPLHVTGTTASPGFARGPLHVLDDDVAPRSRRVGDAQHEAGVLRAALTTATDELSALLANTSDTDAQALLEFQIAMLGDETLAEPAFAGIAGGSSAETAWSAALDAQANEYRTGGDAYFAARAIDLEDMRDRVLRCIAGSSPPETIPRGAIVVATDLAPSRFLEIPWNGGGIALLAGSTQSHVATLARARGVPMIVSMTLAGTLPPGDVLLDAGRGVLIAAPDRESLRDFDARRAAAAAAQASEAQFITRPAFTADGERVRVLLNVAHPDDLDGICAAHCDGIGLVRTELLLPTLPDLHDEDRQFAQYRTIVAWAQGRPVTFRTLDAGGDKPIGGYTKSGEPNPFMGMRGIRLSLLHPQIFGVQLRAIVRAAVLGNVSLMVPMVTRPDELEHVRALLSAAVTDLRAAGVACTLPRLGMMVEVPAAALTIDTFAADFFSIGSNDLVAYVAAVARDAEDLAALTDPLQPAVTRLIAAVVATARAAGREVSLCGDMASDPGCLPALLAAGLRSVSIAPAQLGGVKAAIAAYSESGGD